MRALRFERTGSLENLTLTEVAVPRPEPGELLVRVSAAALNPSDAKNVLGKMHETSVPRTPGRDFAGIVEAGPAEWLGRAVFGTGGNLGFGRDGSHAEYLVLPASAAVAVPRGMGAEQAAAIGLPYLTASLAVGRAARLQRGETVVVLGTTGSVGGAAARLAHRIGARVIGVTRTARMDAKAKELPVDGWINLEQVDLAKGCRELTGGRGADVVFDTVGGPVFESALAAVARGGRQVAIASGGSPRVSFNLVDFYHNETTLIGVDSLKAGFEEAGRLLRELVPAFESGEFPPPEVEVAPLERGPELYRELDAGRLKAKIVLTATRPS